MAIKFLQEPGQVSEIEKKDIVFKWLSDSYTWQPPMPPSDGGNRSAVMPKAEPQANFVFSFSLFFRFLNQPHYKKEAMGTVGQDKIGRMEPWGAFNNLIGEASYNFSTVLELLLGNYEKVIQITPDQSQITAEYYIEVSESYGSPPAVRSSLKSSTGRVTMQLKRSIISPSSSASSQTGLVLALQPAALSLSQNEVLFQLRSSVFLDTPAVHYSGEFKLPVAVITTVGGKRRPAYQNTHSQTVPLWPDAQGLEFKFSDQSVKLWPVDIPDGSGHQFFEDCTSIAQLAPYLQANYLLAKHFEIEQKLDCLIFKARLPGPAFNLSGNDFLKSLTVGVDRADRANFKFLFEVFFRRADETSFDCIFSAQIAQDVPFSGLASIDIGGILDAFLEDDICDIKHASPHLCQKSVGKFFIQCAEVYGQPAQVQKVIKSDTKTVLKGGLAIRAQPKNFVDYLAPVSADVQQDRFLKVGQRWQDVHVDQPIKLFFINTRAENLQLRLKKTIELLDGSSLVSYSGFCNSALLAKICFDVSLEDPNTQQVTCSLEDQDGKRVSEEFVFFVNHEYLPECRFFAYVSSLGALETFSTRGEGAQFYDIISETVENGNTWDSKVQIQFNNRLKRTFKVSTGLQNKRSYEGLADFFLSEKKYVIEKNKLVPIIVTSKKAGNTSDWQRVHICTFEFQYAAEETKYTTHD